MTIKRKRFTKGIELKPTDLNTEDLSRQGELALDSSNDKLKYRNATSTKEVVNTDEAQALSNKSIQDPSRSDIKKDTEANLIAYAQAEFLATGVLSNGQLCFATDTKKAYQVVDGALVELGSGSGGGDAGSVTYSGTLNATNVEDALNEVDADLGSHVASATAHTADDIVNVPSGNLSSITQQDVNNELQDSIDTLSGGGNDIAVEDEGVLKTSAVTKFNFTGAGVTATEAANEVTVDIPSGGGSGQAITVVDESTTLTTDVSKFTFAGTGVTVTEPVANEVQVTIPAPPVASAYNWVISPSGFYNTGDGDNANFPNGGYLIITDLDTIFSAINTNPITISVGATLLASRYETSGALLGNVTSSFIVERNTGTGWFEVDRTSVQVGSGSIGSTGLLTTTAPIGTLIDYGGPGGSYQYRFIITGTHFTTIDGTGSTIKIYIRQDG